MRWPWQRRPSAVTTKALPPATASASADAAAPVATASASASAAITPAPAAPTSEAVTKAASITQPLGADGVANIGGFVVSAERDPRLTGIQKWTTYDNMVLNVAVISAAVNVWTQLGGSAKWTVEPNKRGGADALAAAQIVTEGLLENQALSIPWRQVVRRQLMKKFRGFALHETVWRRRPDGVIVLADLQDRPQWTVWRWLRPDPQGSWIGIEQMVPSQGQGTYQIPRERLFYSVENTLSATPDGIGLFRQLAEPVRVLELFERWEGIGFQTDLRGIPVARAPLEELQLAAGQQKTDAERRAFVATATKFLTDFLFGHEKTAEQGVMLDSATYRNRDPGSTVTSVQKWAFDLIKGATSSMPEVGQAIGRKARDIARIMCAEWLMLGGEDSGGAYSMHEDKTAMFGLIVNSTLDDIADDATRDIATPLVALNGFDPETCTPRLVPEPIATGAVKDACLSLQALASAALDPRDKAINVLRGRLNLPPAPELDAYDLALGGGGAPEPEPVGGEPVDAGVGEGDPGNPNAGEGGLA